MKSERNQDLEMAQVPSEEAVATKPKKRWWIAVLAIVLVLAVAFVVWYFFFDGKMLFASDMKLWKEAEEEAIFQEGSWEQTLRRSRRDFIENGKSGLVAENNLIVDINSLDGEDSISKEAQQTIENIGFNIRGQLDISQEDPLIDLLLALTNKSTGEEAVSLNAYNVDKSIVVEVPDLFDKAIVLDEKLLESYLEDEYDDIDGLKDKTVIEPDDLKDVVKTNIDNMTALSEENVDKILNDLREIFYKYTGEPERVRDHNLECGKLSQKVDYYEAMVSGEQLPEMLKEMLSYLNDNQDTRDFVKFMSSYLNFMTDYYLDTTDISQSLRNAIDYIRDNPLEFNYDVKRVLYVDNSNNPIGDRLTLISHAEDSLGESLYFERIYLEKENDAAYRSFISLPEGASIEYLSEYFLQDGTKTGDFKVKLNKIEEEVNGFILGEFTDFAIDSTEDNFYPVGKVMIRFFDEDDDPDSDTDVIRIEYNGQTEKIDGKQHLLADIILQSDEEFEGLRFGIKTDLYVLKAKDVKMKTEIPSDYITFDDEEAMTDLFSDSSFNTKLMEILAKLDINIMDLIS